MSASQLGVTQKSVSSLPSRIVQDSKITSVQSSEIALLITSVLAAGTIIIFVGKQLSRHAPRQWHQFIDALKTKVLVRNLMLNNSEGKFDDPKSIPCRACRYYKDSVYLECTVHPKAVRTRRAIGCRDFHPVMKD
jgi:hypothetical protein